MREFLDTHAELYPNAVISSNLFMPNKSNTTQIENLASWFQLGPKIKIGDFNSITVDFLQPGREKELWENGNGILQILDVNEKVNSIMPEIQVRTALFLDYLNKVQQPVIESLISKKCFACKFKNFYS